MKTRRAVSFTAIGLIVVFAAHAGDAKKPKGPPPNALDRYVEEATRGSAPGAEASAGSLWSPNSRLTRLGSDLRATQVNDLVTILVSERASAVAQGTTKTQRQSAVTSAIAAVGGVKNPAGPLANLANVSGSTQLDGQGATSRTTQLSTTLSARITQVLPNGYLVVEGNKEVIVNSERQIVTVRGVIRPVDITPGNIVPSDQIAQMELKINGKGVVGDAVRRPFILFRLLLGLLPI